jgi:hypothetical protein
MAADANRLAAALDYLERIKRQAVDFGGGVASNLAERAKSAGGLAYEALTSDPNIGRMTTAEFSQAAADRQTPRLDQAAQDIGTIGKAIVTQPIQTGKAIVQGEIERAQGATQSPRAAGEYAGSFIDPARMAAALRKTGPVMAELDVYHGTPHRFPATEANPLGEFDASKIGTGEGAQAYGHGVYLAEQPEVANRYRTAGAVVSASSRAQELANRAFDVADGNKTKALEWLQKRANDLPESQKELRQTYLDALNNYDSIRTQGNFYTADLPDEMVDRMLDWDKPLSEQPEAVRKFFEPMVANLRKVEAQSSGTEWGELATPRKYDPTGQELMSSLGQQVTNGVISAQNVLTGGTGGAVSSKVLQKAGIPGIRYLDAGSRGQGGSGTRNFVVFPGEEKKVKILKRE